MKNNGRKYEQFVSTLYNNLLSSENVLKYKNIVLDRNKKLTDKNGIDREFDIYWEYEIAGLIIKNVIECKDYNSNITIDKIDAFVGKLSDIPDVKGVFATKCGYQSGAMRKAELNGIQLLVVREPNDDDWIDDAGNFYIRHFHINIKATFPNKIIAFNPTIDKEWIEENNNDFPSNTVLNDRVDKIILINKELGTRICLYDFAETLSGGTLLDNGNYLFEKETINEFLEIKNYSLKLKKYSIEYRKESSTTIPIHIDQADYMFGIIEFLNLGKRKAVFKDGRVIDWK